MARNKAKEGIASARLDDADDDKLEAICHKYVRNRSDMIRFLIRQEYERLFSRQRLEHRTTDGMISYDELERLR